MSVLKRNQFYKVQSFKKTALYTKLWIETSFKLSDKITEYSEPEGVPKIARKIIQWIAKSLVMDRAWMLSGLLNQLTTMKFIACTSNEQTADQLKTVRFSTPINATTIDCQFCETL